MSKKYTVSGNVRGTILTTDSVTEALQALQSDKDSCGKQGGYSDCDIYLTDGGDILKDEEYLAAVEWAIEQEQEELRAQYSE